MLYDATKPYKQLNRVISSAETYAKLIKSKEVVEKSYHTF